MAERNSKMLKCDECDHEFRKESNFNFHKDALHKDVLTSSYFCEVEGVSSLGGNIVSQVMEGNE